MPKIQKDISEEKSDISHEMIQKCKQKICSFKDGATDNERYDKFLVSVFAQNPQGDVKMYPNSAMPAYFTDHLKDCSHSLADGFILDRFKQMTSDHDGKRYETGWWAPRSFWDFIRRQS